MTTITLKINDQSESGKNLLRFLESLNFVSVLSKEKTPDIRQKTNESKSGSRETVELTSFIKSMQTGVHIPADIADKAEYGKHLEEKYK